MNYIIITSKNRLNQEINNAKEIAYKEGKIHGILELKNIILKANKDNNVYLGDITLKGNKRTVQNSNIVGAVKIEGDNSLISSNTIQYLESFDIPHKSVITVSNKKFRR